MCAKEGGHLTNIETMTEHNFLSLLLYTVDDGKVYRYRFALIVKNTFKKTPYCT